MGFIILVLMETLLVSTGKVEGLFVGYNSQWETTPSTPTGIKHMKWGFCNGFNGLIT